MKSIIIFSLIAMSSGYSYGQSTDTSTTNVPEKSTLTLGTVYANNASYYGQKAEDNTPYVAIAANYQLKSGIYFTGQTYKLLNENTNSVSAASLGAGINFTLGKNLLADLSYSHSFYPKYSPLLQAGNTDNASISLSYDGWVKPAITGDYAFGKTGDAFLTAGLSKSINLFSIGKKDLVVITPEADAVGGTQHFIKTYVTEKKKHDDAIGVITGPIFGYPPASYDSSNVATTDLNVLSYNVKLPLAYYRSHYVVEAAYQLSLLSDKAQSGAGKVNSFFTFSFYYQF